MEWPAADPTPQIGFEFSVPAPGDILVVLVDAVVSNQTSNWGPAGTIQGNLKAWFRAKT